MTVVVPCVNAEPEVCVDVNAVTPQSSVADGSFHVVVAVQLAPLPVTVIS